MKFKKYFLFVTTLILFSSVAFSGPDDKYFTNPVQDGDLIFEINKGGSTHTSVFTVDGPTGVASFPFGVSNVVTSPGTSSPVLFGARIANSGSASITYQVGNRISSVNRTGAGTVTVTYAEAFGTVPVVTVSADTANDRTCSISSTTTSGCVIYCWKTDNVAAVDINFAIQIVGEL